MRTRLYIFLASAALVLAGCSDKLEMPYNTGQKPSPVEVVPDGTPIDVPFCVNYSPMTKSSISAGEDSVSDINIIAFKNGVRTTFVYTDPDSDISLQLLKGEEYNIYAVANVGSISIPSSEEEFLGYSYSIAEAAEMNGGFPMSWKLEGFTAGVLTSPVDIELERLVAKVRLSMVPGEVTGYSVTSVRLCQAAGVIRPFAAGGSKVEDPSETADGDYASAADLSNLNDGGSIYFYTLENAQGTLLEGNTNPWNKVPDNMDGLDDVCTYIEITCEHDGSFLLEGTVTYRLYLGADNCSNFDVLRNKTYNLTLTTTYGGMNEPSWKVDVDVDITDGVEGGVDWSMHDIDDLYIGEEVLVGFNSSVEFDHFHGAEPLDCEVVLMKNGVESDAAWFDLIDDGSNWGIDHNYGVEMHCVDEINGAELYLKKDGALVAKIPMEDSKKVKIQKPYIGIETHSTGTGYVSWVTINNNSQWEEFLIHFLDSEGQDIRANAYGFELEPFEDLWSYSASFNGTLHNVDGSINGKSLEKRMNECVDLSFDFRNNDVKCDVTISNSGEYADVCYDLSYNLYNRHSFNVIVENEKCISGSQELFYEAAQTIVSMYDDSLTDEYGGGTAVYLKIYNPSHLIFNCYAEVLGYAPSGTFTQIHEDHDYSSNKYYFYNDTNYQDIRIAGSAKKAFWGYLDWGTYIPSTVSHQSIYDNDGLVHVDYSNLDEGEEMVQLFVDGIGVAEIRDIYGYAPSESAYTRPDGGKRYHPEYLTSTYSQNDGIVNINCILPDGSGLTYYSGTRNCPNCLYPSGGANWTYCPINYYCGSSGSDVNGIEYNSYFNLTEKQLFDKLNNPYNFQLNVTNNSISIVVPSGVSAIVDATATVSGNCTWRNYSTTSYSTRRHSKSSSVTYSGVSGTKTLFSSSDMTSLLQALNRNYWHNCSDAAVAAQGNRYSAMTIPDLIVYDIKITLANNTCYTIRKTMPATDLSFSAYTRTVAGSYADSGSTNPDGTDRDVKNIKNGPTFSGASTSTVTIPTYLQIDENCSHFYKLGW